MESVRAIDLVTRHRRPFTGLRIVQPEVPSAPRPGVTLASAQEPEAPAGTGRFDVAAGSGASLGPLDSDVVIFINASATVAPAGGSPEPVDPNIAVICRRGTTSTWTAPAWTDVRCHLVSPVVLRGAAPLGALGGSRERTARTPMALWTFPTLVYLAQKLLVDKGQWRDPAAFAPASAAPVVPIRWRRIVVWDREGRRRHGGSTLVRRVRTHLAQEPGAAERLKAVAERFGYSEGHLSREFKRELGVTIHTYRHELRMRAAVDLLADETGDLVHLALGLGYASHSHFSARFLRTFGLTPSSCRELLRHGVASGDPAGPDELGDVRWRASDS